jgi:hypothetical protein
MIKEGFSNIVFQTFYISNEVSNCPFIDDFIKTVKKFKSSYLSEKLTGICISFCYGRRVLINSDKINLEDIKKEDFLEIIVLVMGPKEPMVWTPIHWFIHHAREDVNAVIQINDKRFVENLKYKYPVAEKEYPSGSIEQVKEVLKCLSNSKTVVIKNQGVIFVGKSLNEVEELILKIY